MNGYAASNNGIAGFGATGQNAAGLGGAMFLLHTSSQINGNNQGMTRQLPTLFTCSVQYSNNQADTDVGEINNNDDIFDEAKLSIGISGESIGDDCLYDQEIEVSGMAVEIESGDTSPNIEDGTDFGNVIVQNNPRIMTYKITNTGTSLLVLNGAERLKLLENESGLFSIHQYPAVDNLSFNESAEFKISFAPVTLANYSAKVLIKNNDSNEPNYTYTITGEGIAWTDLIFEDGFE